METFEAFLEGIDDSDKRMRTEEVLSWVKESFPDLETVIKWNQPMFTDYGTYIIGFSVSKKHLAVAPEQAGINQFLNEISEAGYDHTKEIIRMPWDQPIDYSLLEKLITFNRQDKADHTSFWR